LETFINEIILEINSGKSIVIHCRMGIGRASVIASSILLKYNFGIDEIIANIIHIRGLKVPDTEEQLQWLKSQTQKI
jgi:protein-tyrosine phosphatase